jgi:hypothetical protein
MGAGFSRVCNKFFVLATLMVLGSIPGCARHGDIDLLLRDLRLQEDRIYELEEQLTQSQAQIESCRRAYESLQKSAPSSNEPPRLETLPPETQTQQPEVTIGDPVSYRPESSSFAENSLLADRTENRTMKIAFNALLTGGYDFDGQPGDEGLLVVLEQFDSDGEPVQNVGSLSIVVVDASRTGPESRVARWDFHPDELVGHVRKTALGHGLHFELPWPANPPRTTRLRLLAQFNVPGGDKLFAERELTIEPLQGKRARSAVSGRNASVNSEVAGPADGRGRPLRSARNHPQWTPYR